VAWFETTNTTTQPSLHVPFHQKKALQLEEIVWDDQGEHKKITGCFLPFISACYSSLKLRIGTMPVSMQLHRPNHYKARCTNRDYFWVIRKNARRKSDAEATG
jgi:hypothetical protein